MADFQTRWRNYFLALDANGNGFLEPEDAVIVAQVCYLVHIPILQYL